MKFHLICSSLISILFIALIIFLSSAGMLYGQQQPHTHQQGDAYAVQIAVSPFPLQSTEAQFKGTTVEEENDNGYYKYKYVTGRTTNFEEALQTQQKMLESGFKGAFVVAYKEGKRMRSKTVTKEIEKPIAQVVKETPAPAEAKRTDAVKTSVTAPGIGYAIAQTEPEFPGGDDSLQHYIQMNLKQPQASMQSGEWKQAYVSFIVDRNGKVQNPNILSGTHAEADSVAVQFVRDMPDWKPAMVSSTPVDKQYILPLSLFVPKE